MPYSDLLNSKLNDLSTTAGNAVADLAGVVAGADVLASQFADVKNALEDLQQFVNEFKGGYYYTPVGLVAPFGGASTEVPPAGWLLCSGQEVAIASYGELYAVLTAAGTAFPYGANTNGSGSAGSSHFRLPDLRGRTLVGVGSAASGATLTGTLGGVQGVNGGSTTLTSSHIPQHTHSVSASGTTSGHSNDHSHGFNDYYTAATNVGNQLASGSFYGRFSFSTPTTPNSTGGASADHTHTYSFSTTSGAYGTASPTAVSAVQPSIGLNYIIKA